MIEKYQVESKETIRYLYTKIVRVVDKAIAHHEQGEMHEAKSYSKIAKDILINLHYYYDPKKSHYGDQVLLFYAVCIKYLSNYNSSGRKEELMKLKQIFSKIV